METGDLAVLIKLVQLFDEDKYIYNWELNKEQRKIVDDAREVVKKYRKPSAS